MKKLLLILLLLILFCGLVWFFFLRDKSTPKLGELFTPKGDGSPVVIIPSDTQADTPKNDPPYETPAQIPVQDPKQPAEDSKPEGKIETSEDTPKTTEDTPETSDKKPDNTPEASADNTEKPSEEQKEPENTFSHSDNEKQKIIADYLRAEEFYYDILFQRYDLDGYDVIKRKNSDGYETEYHRVLYYDVNSIADLKKYYLEYFTKDFVNSIDFGAYLEADGKLYCAMTDSSADNSIKYTYSVESTDEQNAYVIRTDSHGNGSTKIGAENIGGSWYFSSVAIK